MIADDLSLRRLKFADELMKEHDDIPEAGHAARPDADFTLMSDTPSALQARVVAVFGGAAE